MADDSYNNVQSISDTWHRPYYHGSGNYWPANYAVHHRDDERGVLDEYTHTYLCSTPEYTQVLGESDLCKLLMLLGKLACDELNKNAFRLQWYLQLGASYPLRTQIENSKITTTAYGEIELKQLLNGEPYFDIYPKIYHNNNDEGARDINTFPLNNDEINKLEILLAKYAFLTYLVVEKGLEKDSALLQWACELYFQLKQRGKQLNDYDLDTSQMVPFDNGELSLEVIEKVILGAGYGLNPAPNQK